MNLSKLLELQNKRAAIADDLLAITANKNLSQEEREQRDKLFREADQLGDLIAGSQARELDADLRQSVRPVNGPISADAVTDAREWKKPGNWIKRRKKMVVDPAFDRFLRTGDKFGLREQRDMGISYPTASIPTSVFVPQGFVDDVEIARKFYGEIGSVARDYPTLGGAPLPWPTTNDTTVEAEIVGEGQEVSTADVTIGNLVFQAWKYSTRLVKVSLELLQDSAFDLNTYLVEQFAIRLARKLESDFVLGNGVNMPRGILLDAPLGAIAGGSAANTGDDTQDGTNSIGTTDLIKLIYSVDPWYRKNGTFVMHDQTKGMLSQLLDKFGRPLFTPNPQTGKLESIFGYPVKLNNYIETIGSSSPASPAITVLFGDFSKYIVRRAKDFMVLRLTERYAEYGQVGFIGFARYDARLLDAGTNPIKYLEQAA